MEPSRFIAIPSCSLPEEQRHSRIKTLLSEIRREKPLGKCPLFKMTLTFRSFVWAPVIDSMYASSVPQKLEKVVKVDTISDASKKPFIRSQSATSLKSGTGKGLEVENKPTEKATITQNSTLLVTPGKVVLNVNN